MPRITLFDTDVLIDYAREVPAAVCTLETVRRNDVPGVSVITYLELLTGCRDKRELLTLDAFIQSFRLVPIDTVISQYAQKLMRDYRLSHGLRMPDAFIAATAFANGCPLISKNQKDYRFMTGLTLPPYPVQ